MLQYGSRRTSCISYCRDFSGNLCYRHKPSFILALSDCGRKNEFHSTRFRTNEIYVIWNNTADAAELYLKCFIKNVFDLFLLAGRRESPNRIGTGFPELRNAYEGCHNLRRASGVQDGRVSAPFNYGINHANGSALSVSDVINARRCNDNGTNECNG